MTTLDKMAYTIDEAAEVASVSVTTIREAYRSGALPVTKPTSRPLILRADLEAWLLSFRVAS